MPSPNLLFLMTDQQRADTIEPHTACQTPHLDALAARGVQFDRCYAPNPICSPTRASLMTGLLPHSHGMVDVTHAVDPTRASLKPNLPFWSRTLQQAGYHTGYFGKWHIERSNRLEDFGFAEYDVARYHQLKGLVEKRENLLQHAVVRQPGYRDFLLYGVTPESAEVTPEYRLYSDGIDFVRRAAQNPDQPWALFLSSEAPHDPYLAPQEYYARYNPADIPPPPSFTDALADRPAIYRRIQRVWEQLEWPQFAEATACYYAFCSLVDDQIGRILAVLDELGQTENTIIVFCSDHGDYMGAHRLMLKGIPAFEEAYRVPLIMAGPGLPAGQRIGQIVSLLDVGSTLTPLTTGDDFPGHGRSLLPLWQGKSTGWSSEALAECHGQRFNYTQRTLWRDNLKYIFNGFADDELYDLAADPHELHNLAADPAFESTIAEMAARMWQILRQTGDVNMTEAEYGMFRFAPVGPQSVD
jgi:arylsulfatase A-like enzyme